MAARDKHWLLATDLDGTLIGDTPALAQFRRLWEESLHRGGWLVYSSGRFIPSMRESVVEHQLPQPDFLIGGVGTRIETGGGQHLAEWDEHIGVGWDREHVRHMFHAHPEIELQPEEFQGPYKISGFWWDARLEAIRDLEQEIRRGRHSCRLVYSSQRDLDALPATANKGSSVAFLAGRLGIPRERVMCCGDSANDADFFNLGFGAGILVGNAHPDLCALAPRAYRASAPHAAGIIEGLRHHGYLK